MNNSIPILFGLIFLAVLVPSSAFAQVTSTDNLYSCGSSDGTDIAVHLRDKLTGISYSSNAWSITGLSNIQGCQGMAQDPTDYQWYAIIEDSGLRYLASVDPSDGSGTLIGATDSTANSLAISNSGVFYTANGSDEIMTINKGTGGATFACQVADGQGETVNRLAYNYELDQLVALHSGTIDLSSFLDVSEINTPSGATCGSVDVQSSIIPTGMNVAQDNLNDPYSWAFHTVDQLFYTFHADAFGSGNEYFISNNGFPEGKSLLLSYTATLLNANPLSDSTGLKTLTPIDTVTMGLAFAFAGLPPDTTPPVVTLVGSTPVNVPQFGTYTEWGATCLDDVDGQIDGNVVIGGDIVDEDTVATYIVDYDCQDNAGNDAITVQRTVNVIADSTDPVISTTASQPISLLQNSVFTPLDFVTASDNIDGDITGSITVQLNNVNTANTGIQTVVYEVEDSAENSVQKIVEFLVQKQSTGTSSGSTSSSFQSNSGIQSSTPSLSDIPPLTKPSTPAPTQQTPTRTGNSISDIFANLFQNRLDPNTGTTTTDQTPQKSIAQQISERVQGVTSPSPSTTGQPSQGGLNIVNAISNFFSNFFR